MVWHEGLPTYLPALWGRTVTRILSRYWKIADISQTATQEGDRALFYRRRELARKLIGLRANAHTRVFDFPDSGSVSKAVG